MKLERLLSIILLLLNKERISAQKLADTFEVSLRTIYRDLDTLNRAGFPIQTQPGVGGGIEISKDYKLDRQVFSTSDLTSILLGLSNFANVLQGDAQIHAITKIRSLIPVANVKAIDLKVKQIHIDLNPWLGNKNIQAIIDIIRRALDDQKLLTFDYTDRHGRQSSRQVEPYQLVLKSHHWYFQAFCLEKQDFRLFRCSRLANLHLSSETFNPRVYQEPLLNVHDIIAPLQTTIKLRIHQSLRDRLLDFCPIDCFITDDETHDLVNFPFIENDYYYSILLSFGKQCECLGPAPIRQEMKKRLVEMLSLYDA